MSRYLAQIVRFSAGSLSGTILLRPVLSKMLYHVQFGLPSDPPASSHSENAVAESVQSEAERLQAYRTDYARLVTAAAGIPPGSDIEAALAAVPREKYVGPPPWRVLSGRGRPRTTSDDPAVLYRDVLISLGGEPGLNNGQPSLHAMCLAALDLKRGERVVHVGAGTGYYTAAIAILVGETGVVDAYEIEPDLAARAKENLAEFRQVEVHAQSGAAGLLPECDAIYVNAAAAEPLAIWLDALRPGARLLFPLAATDGTGEMLMLTRNSGVEYAARFLGPVQFVPCIGAQEEHAGGALHAAFRRGRWRDVHRLVRNNEPDENCWLCGEGWWMGR
jgi:protein-L-isoaspartate(D-aspartate) O-methyltransferase